MTDEEHPLDKKFREQAEEAARTEVLQQEQTRLAEELRAHTNREWSHAEERLKEEIELANQRLAAYAKSQAYRYCPEPQPWDDMFRSHVQLHDNQTVTTVYIDIRIAHGGDVLVTFRDTGVQERFPVGQGSSAIWRNILAELHKHLPD